MSTKDKGDEYEDFSAEIISKIRELEQVGLVRPISIEQKVKLQAPYGAKREIDILITYLDSESRKLKAAIECKDYKSAVSVEKIEAFRTKCDNLKIDKAIFFSKNGFQKGAIQSAEYNHIQLIELRKPTETDWEGRVRNILITLNANFVKILHCSIDACLGVQQCACLPDETEIICNGEATSFYKLALDDSLGKEQGVYEFDKNIPNSHLKFNDEEYCFSRIHIKYYLHIIKHQIIIKGDEIVLAILKSFGYGDFSFLRDGSLRPIDNED